MYDSIRNVGDFLSPHWLSEAFPGKLRTLTKEWRERTEHGKPSPLRGLTGIAYVSDILVAAELQAVSQ